MAREFVLYWVHGMGMIDGEVEPYFAWSIHICRINFSFSGAEVILPTPL